MQHTTKRTFATRMGGLDFTMRVPTEWVEEAINSTSHDFSDAAALAPLAILRGADSTFAVDARPVYGSGTLRKWAYALQEAHGLNVYSLDEQDVGAVQAEHQEHLSRPDTESLDCHDRLNHLIVSLVAQG